MTDKLKPGELKPCPFCGDRPTFENCGTVLDITCCVSMDIQKTDYLTIGERMTFSYDTYRYSDEAEAKCLRILTDKWNTRKGG